LHLLDALKTHCYKTSHFRKNDGKKLHLFDALKIRCYYT